MIDALDDVDITGTDDVPVTESVRLHGPPGTGKTTQSAARVATLIRDHGYAVDDVCWATYRRALATDTLQRLKRWGILSEDDLDRPHRGSTRFIATTHAVANRLFDNDDRQPATMHHKIDFCDKRDLRWTTGDRWSDGPGELIFDCFSWLRSNLLDPSDPNDVRRWDGYDDLRDNWRGSVPNVWEDWTAYKRTNDLIDFTGMLERCVNQRITPLKDIVVVDEYHDVTPLMAKLSQQWIDQAQIAIAAGDPHQVVNSFEGASPRFFKKLDLPSVLLDTTYRVPEEHWRLATWFLYGTHDIPPVSRRKRGRIEEYRSPRFFYQRGRADPWTLPNADTAGSPVWLLDRIPDDESVMFLTRTQMQAIGVAGALADAGVIFNTQSTLDAGWDAGTDRRHVHNALQQLRKIEPGDLNGRGGITDYVASDVDPHTVTLTPDEAATILEYTNAKYLAQTRSATDEIVDNIRADADKVSLADMDDYVTADFWTTYTAGKASVDRLNKRELSDGDRHAIRRALQRYDDPARTGADTGIAVLTIHASKGRDADHVVLYDGITSRISREMNKSDATQANEHRTWYVACTRAKKTLHIMRDGFDWTTSVIPQDIGRAIGLDGDTRADTGGGETA